MVDYWSIRSEIANARASTFNAELFNTVRCVSTMTKRINRDYTTRDELTMREMVAAGCSIVEVAKRLNRTYAATAQRLSTLGIATRAPRYTPEQCERILTCYADNQLLAREMNRTPDMIIMKRYKLKKAMRSRGAI